MVDTVWVIMKNDFPHAVKSTQLKAKRWVDKQNKAEAATKAFRDANSGWAGTNSPRNHYKYYGFMVDGKMP